MKLEPLNTLASDFLPWMAGIQARSLFLLAVTGVAMFLLRRSSAAIRHLVLSSAVLSLLALPLLSFCLPSWSVPALPTPAAVLPPVVSGGGGRGRMAEGAVPAETKRVTAAAPAATEDPFPNHSGAIAGDGSSVAAGISGSSPVPQVAVTIVFLVWVLGALLLLLRLGIGLLRLRRMAEISEPVGTVAPALAEVFVTLCSPLGLRRPVRLVIGTPEMPGLSPMTWGLWRPVVLFPAESQEWSEARQRPVLLHEIAHVQRGDWATGLMACVVCALYWPNPMVWLLVRRLRSESECACDDRVLRAGVAPADYAYHLVEVARSIKAQRGRIFVPSAAVMMAQRSGVGGRVSAVLAKHRSRVPATVRVVALALVGAASLLLPLANLRVASAGGQKNDADNTPIRLGGRTFYNGALPLARLLARMKPNRKMTFEEYRAYAATRSVPGSDRFPPGVVAEGLEVSGMQPDGSVSSWDRAGNLLSSGPNWKWSGLKAGELHFRIDRLKLPDTPEWIDKTTFDRLKEKQAFESQFGVVGGPAGYLGFPGGIDYGNGYHNLSESDTWVPEQAVAKVDLYLSIGYGPWLTLGVSPRTGTVPPVAPEKGVTLSPLVTRRGGVYAEVVASVPARFLALDSNGRPLWRLRLEPIDADGNVVGKPRVAQYTEYTEATGPQSRLRFRFITSELAFEKVTSARLLARPFHTVYFRDVPTRPKAVPAKTR
ncbi:MAG: M56 family metallopeptidase [Akkermansiaceae bacterium]|nr:M56 family metallopeptidase [Armatimonadota bacterium]